MHCACVWNREYKGILLNLNINLYFYFIPLSRRYRLSSCGLWYCVLFTNVRTSNLRDLPWTRLSNTPVVSAEPPTTPRYGFPAKVSLVHRRQFLSIQPLRATLWCTSVHAPLLHPQYLAKFSVSVCTSSAPTPPGRKIRYTSNRSVKYLKIKRIKKYKFIYLSHRSHLILSNVSITSETHILQTRKCISMTS